MLGLKTGGSIMRTLYYKGFEAQIRYSEKDGCFIGRLTGIAHAVGFHTASEKELDNAFKKAVDDYVEICKKKK